MAGSISFLTYSHVLTIAHVLFFFFFLKIYKEMYINSLFIFKSGVFNSVFFFFFLMVIQLPGVFFPF